MPEPDAVGQQLTLPASLLRREWTRRHAVIGASPARHGSFRMAWKVLPRAVVSNSLARGC